MVIFILPVIFGIEDPKIYRDYRRTIRPDGRDQVDPLNNPVMLPAPMPGNQFDLMGIGFVESTIIDYEYLHQSVSSVLLRYTTPPCGEAVSLITA